MRQRFTPCFDVRQQRRDNYLVVFTDDKNVAVHRSCYSAAEDCSSETDEATPCKVRPLDVL